MSISEDFRRLTGLTDVRVEAMAGGDDRELLARIKKQLDVLQPALHKAAESLSGTVGWESHDAAVTYGAKTSVTLLLIANQRKGTVVTMDRIRINLTPYKPGPVEAVLDLHIDVSRLVRDTVFGQKADRELETDLWVGDLTASGINTDNLLFATKVFWKKAAGLKPKPMRGGQDLSVEDFDILRVLGSGPMTSDHQSRWLRLEERGFIKQTIPGAVPGRRVFVITSAGRAAMEDAP